MIQMKFESNFDALKGQFLHARTGHARQHRITTATISNFAAHAAALHNRKGFYMFSHELLAKYVRSHFKRLESKGKLLDDKIVELTLEKAIIEYVNWLRGYSGPAVKPFRKGEKPRRGHPGGWGDITGYTRNAFRYRINNGEWKTRPAWEQGLARAEAEFARIYPGAKPRQRRVSS